MTEWATAREIAAARLPGLPASKFRLIEFAKKYAWPSRAVKGRRGGGLEYRVASVLNVEQLAALATKSAEVEPGTELPAVTGTPANATKAEINAAIERFEGASEKVKSRARLAAQAVEMAESEIRSGVPRMKAYENTCATLRVKLSSLREWCKEARRFPRDFLSQALCGKWGEAPRSNFVKSNPEIAAFLAGVILERKNLISDEDLWRAAREICDRRSAPPGG